MSRLLEVAEKELIRQEILSMCSMTAPAGANSRVLQISLKKSGYDLTEDAVLQQAQYLKEKGLVDVKKVENRTLGINRSIVSITAAGTDFLEGNLPEIAGIGV